MTGRAADNLKTRLRSDLRAAMLARDTKQAAVLRVLLAAIDNAEAVAIEERPQSLQRLDFAEGAAEVSRRVLGEDEVAAILTEEISARRLAADQMAALGRADRAGELNAEADVVARYLQDQS
ncbi:GatB/YqeY domain-containing protein [Novosphingobium sp. G106]|uniref:GatB/YqeY domain-containing protein n=1 Tax=Novosphingobium sp. G106 TaxID=2849500 RepID=UPI001C2CC789|nr:GatB/YqeY domain-containing protein [Novosphingobium sp. G106]MBV1686893.1 GatB/YqeY domain-containing protein [Novosphingobium sp. G106]